MSDYDLTNTPTDDLENDLRNLRHTQNVLHVTDGPSARKYADISEEIQEITDELRDREPAVYTVACRGGCGKVYDLPEPTGYFVCRRCQMMGRA